MLPKVLALIVVTMAVWWIARSLVAPFQPIQSTGALLHALGAEQSSAGADPLSLPTPDPAGLERARSLLRKEPLAAEAYAVLAIAASKAGQDEKAARLMRIAAEWWPRDLLVQSWLLARSLRLGDRQAAVARFDVIARVHPETLDAMTEAVTPLLADPDFGIALTDRLATRPPWRTRFIDIAVRQWLAPTGVIALVDRLQNLPTGLDAAELRPYLSRLLAAGRVDQAYLAWLRSLPRARRASLGYLYNGQFQYPLVDMPFDWQMPGGPGVRVTLSDAPAGHVLTLGFLGGRVAFKPIQHDLFLAPGNYRLKGRVSTDRLLADQGLRWRVACVDDPDHVQASSELFKGTTAWRDFAMDFVVPETACTAQVLALELYARSASEQNARGIAAFSTLDIEPR